MSSRKNTVIALLIAILIMSISPLLLLKDAEFGGADDAAGDIVAEIKGGEYEPWFTPWVEDFLEGELPGEVESLLFCVQTGIGVGIIAFVMGRWVERKKWLKDEKAL